MEIGFVLQEVLQVGDSCAVIVVISWQTSSTFPFPQWCLVLGEWWSGSHCENGERWIGIGLLLWWEYYLCGEAFNEINSLLNVFAIPLHSLAVLEGLLIVGLVAEINYLKRNSEEI